MEVPYVKTPTPPLSSHSEDEDSVEAKPIELGQVASQNPFGGEVEESVTTEETKLMEKNDNKKTSLKSLEQIDATDTVVSPTASSIPKKEQIKEESVESGKVRQDNTRMEVKGKKILNKKQKEKKTQDNGKEDETWHIEISEFQKIEAEDRWWFEKGIILYTVVSTIPGKGHMKVHRAFSEFQALFHDLLAWYDEVHPHARAKVIVPPAKHWIWEDHTSDMFLSQRRQALHDWMVNLLK
eukprot:Ihof_evm22s5 gene=Ihof_evmTU22s5